MAREFADRSNNNPSPFDMHEYRKDSRLVGLKATEGTHFVDHFHGPLTDEAHHHGVRVVHYAFARLNESPAIEAKLFNDTAAPHFKRKDYMVLDVETKDGQNWAEIRKWVKDFNRLFHKASGHSVVGYSGWSYLQQGLGEDCGIKRWWVAHYSAAQEPKVSFLKRNWAWQYTDGRPRTVGPSIMPGVGKGDTSRLNHASHIWIHTP